MSEALIFARPIVHWITSSIHESFKLKPGENLLCTEIVPDIQNNSCTQHVLSMFCKKKSFWQRFTCIYDFLNSMTPWVRKIHTIWGPPVPRNKGSIQLWKSFTPLRRKHRTNSMLLEKIPRFTSHYECSQMSRSLILIYCWLCSFFLEKRLWSCLSKDKSAKDGKSVQE